MSEIPTLHSLKTKLDYNSSKISKNEWNAYLSWYFEASQCYQEYKITTLQNKILRLTEGRKIKKR